MGTFKASYTEKTDQPVRAFNTVFEPGKSADVDDRFREKVENNPFFKVGGGSATPKSPDGKPEAARKPDGGYEAKHRGGGSYSIMQGDTEVVEKVSKEDAEAFNALSDAEKAEYVKSEQGKA